MKPSELITLLSPNGYIATELMYGSTEPNAIDICNAYKAGVPKDILDKISKFTFVSIDEVENDYSLLKNIEHPGQIVGGYEISKELADTISNYFGRNKLLEAGRPVNSKHYYTEEELTNKTYLNSVLNKNYSMYTRIHSNVKSNSNSSRDLESAKKAYQLYKDGTSLESLISTERPCGAVIFTKDNFISLDAFSIIISFYGRDLERKEQILLDWDPGINTEYKRYRTKDGPIPPMYTKESGKSINSLFKIYKGKDLEVLNWEVVNTTSKAPMYIGKNGEDVVVTVVAKTDEEILSDINSKIDRINKLYGCNMPHMLVSNMGDFFIPTIFGVYC